MTFAQLERVPGSLPWIYRRALEYRSVINPALHAAGHPLLTLQQCVDLQRFLFEAERIDGINEWWAPIVAREAAHAR